MEESGVWRGRSLSSLSRVGGTSDDMDVRMLFG